MEEVWKKFNDRYYVSNKGRVKSLYANKERILKPYLNRDGYLKVDIFDNKKRKSYSVHRLVALCFIDNPLNLKEVNHKDEDKKNNNIKNLEWCDTKYNCNYGTRNERRAKNCYKRVCSIDKQGNIKHYISRNEAAKETGIAATSISKALSNNYPNHKTAGGLFWQYE